MLGQIVVAKIVTSETESAATPKIRIRKACAPRLAALEFPTKVVPSDRADVCLASRRKTRRALR